ncbi:MAG: hypothetical protein Fur0022_17700 [Anaerolineales bacterium]
MESLRKFFSAPLFEGDEEKTRQAQLLQTVLNTQVLVLFVIIGGTIYAMFDSGINLGLQIAVMILALLLIFFWRFLMVRGQLNLASGGMIFFFLTSVTFILASGGTIRSSGIIFLPLNIVLATLLMGRRAGVVTFILTTLSGAFLVEGEIRGLFIDPPNITTPATHAVLFAGLGLTTVLLYLATRNTEEALTRARQNEREVRNLAANLEARVAERTRDLTLSAEISRAVAQKHSLAELLPDAVERIRETFALYYVQIYLTDLTRPTLVLRAGSGEVGRELLRRGHRLPIATGSINGTAAHTKKPILVEDTARSANFLPNPLLPKTRSEMAVPLLSGERVLGVLNMQSEFANTFTQDTLPAYEILAGQLAAAIENAFHFAEIEKARRQIEAQSALLIREGWDGYLDALRHPEFLGVAYHEGEVIPLEKPVQATSNQLLVPIPVAGAEIGTIQLETEARSLLPEEQEVVARLASLAGEHLENLRLLTEAERYRREAELAARRLTREGWDTYQRSLNAPIQGYVYTQNQIRPLDVAEQKGGYAFPLTLRGETIGTLNLLASNGESELTSEETELVATIAETLTAHIENLRLREATETALARTESLYAFTAKLTQANTLSEILQAVYALRPASRVTFLSIAEDEKGSPEWLTNTASWPNDEASAIEGARFPVMDFPVSNLWLNNPDKPLMFEDAQTDPRVKDPQFIALNQQLGIRGSVYLPLRISNHWIGLLGISWSTPQSFSEADKQLFEAVMAQTAIAINNRSLFEQTTRRAEREALINTINQRIQSATTVESALETTAREIGHLLKARRAVVEINPVASNGR